MAALHILGWYRVSTVHVLRSNTHMNSIDNDGSANKSVPPVICLLYRLKYVNKYVVYVSNPPLFWSKVESFRRPAFTELLDELGEVAENLELPAKSDVTMSWVISLKTACIEQMVQSVWDYSSQSGQGAGHTWAKKKNLLIFQPSTASPQHVTVAELVFTWCRYTRYLLGGQWKIAYAFTHMCSDE